VKDVNIIGETSKGVCSTGRIEYTLAGIGSFSTNWKTVGLPFKVSFAALKTYIS
jgi:hypothetical protein